LTAEAGLRMNDKDLRSEANRLEEILKDKTINKVYRNRSNEVVIEFNDGTRFFIEIDGKELEFSIT
jgi:hypothetical protein